MPAHLSRRWPDRTLPPKTRHDLFLVIKEALHNIVSHSGAKNARLEITLHGERLRVTIGDDGQGFDPQSTVLGRPGGGHGLANMRQRMQEVGGTLDIRAARRRYHRDARSETMTRKNKAETLAVAVVEDDPRVRSSLVEILARTPDASASVITPVARTRSWGLSNIPLAS